MACWAGFAPNYEEIHLLSSLRPLCYGKMAFGDKDMGTPLPTSQPVHGDRGLDGVPRDSGVGRGLGEAAPVPSKPGIKSICTQASLRRHWGPSCGTPGEQQPQH